MSNPPPLILIGYRAVGKSTLADRLANATGWEAIHLDAEIERAARRSIADWVADVGWGPFRKMESELLARFLSPGAGPGVILDTGGGVVEAAGNRELLIEHGPALWIDCPTKVMLARMGGDPNRPSLTGGTHAQEIEEVYARRRPWYEACSAARIDTSSLAPEEADQAAREAYRAIHPPSSEDMGGGPP